MTRDDKVDLDGIVKGMKELPKGLPTRMPRLLAYKNLTAVLAGYYKDEKGGLYRIAYYVSTGVDNGRLVASWDQVRGWYEDGIRVQ